MSAIPCRSEIVVSDWLPIYRGVAYATGSADAAESRLQQVRAIRIDLLTPGIKFLATPRDGALETRTMPTSAFLKAHSLQVAINAGFFALSNNFSSLDTDIIGLQISCGVMVSPATTGFGNCSLRITTNNVATFDTVTALPYNTDGIDTAVPGQGLILVNGVANTDTNSVHPRSLIGLSAEGRFLVLVTIDGRQNGYSLGATFKECGEWLQRFGSYNGLALDGGGSTTLVRSDDTGGATVLNRPSDELHRERYVGSHLGVFARNLPRPVPVVQSETLNECQ
jgi:exopolysaccharide biosynthesis protein